MERVDCGPGHDVVHVYLRGLGHAPYPLAPQMTSHMTGRLRDCEVVVGDDVTHADHPRHADITAGWTNAARRNLASGGATATADAERVTYRLYDRDDVFNATSPLQATVRGAFVLGRGGNDRISRTRLSDHLEGKAGNDMLDGVAGDDLLYGRTGDDLLEGGRGNDLLESGAGRDRLTGGFDHDRLYGGSGDDRLNALDGKADVVDCDSGGDTAIVDRHDTVRGREPTHR